MNVWLVMTGEPLPIDDSRARVQRTGLLANALLQRGNVVTWWTSTFDHVLKRHRFDRDTELKVTKSLTLRLLRGTGYSRNISVRRAIDHYVVGRGFTRWAERALDDPKPDVILCSFPTIDLAYEASLLGKKHGIPVVLDVRDLWPELFLDYLPTVLRPVANQGLRPLYRRVRVACAHATAIAGVTDPFVDWGLRMGGRQRTDLDRSFPFGYPEHLHSPADLEVATDFWRRQGVVRSHDLIRVCFIGSFTKAFDFDTVLRAARLLPSSRFQFVLCGDGEMLETVKAHARDLPHVILPGWIDGAQIRALMNISDVGLAPYRRTTNFQGNVPNKAIEYLAGGLPIVTSLSGVLGTLIAELRCGTSHSEHDEHGMASAIDSLRADSRKLQEMKAAARDAFERRFMASNVYGGFARFLESFGMLPHHGALSGVQQTVED